MKPALYLRPTLMRDGSDPRSAENRLKIARALLASRPAQTQQNAAD